MTTKASYQKMMEEKNYHSVRIRQLLADKYLLSVQTIEKIIWGENDRRRQQRAEKKAAQVSPVPT